MGEFIKEPDTASDPEGAPQLFDGYAARRKKLEEEREELIRLGLSAEDVDQWQRHEIDTLNSDIEAASSAQTPDEITNKLL